MHQTFVDVGFHFFFIRFFRPGSVVAIVELVFGKSASDPLKPLQDEISGGKLSSFKVSAMLDVDPSIQPTTTSTH